MQTQDDRPGLIDDIADTIYTLVNHIDAQSAELERLQAVVATKAAKDVLAERERQKAVEGWTPEHDDKHTDGSIAAASPARCIKCGQSVADWDFVCPGMPSPTPSEKLMTIPDEVIETFRQKMAHGRIKSSHPIGSAECERDGIRFALTSAAESGWVMGNGWQQIEKMPATLKDGRWVEMWCRHDNWKYAKTAEERWEWECPVIARWIDHNGGGWTWHGMAGTFTHYREVPAIPTDTGAK